MWAHKLSSDLEEEANCEGVSCTALPLEYDVTPVNTFTMEKLQLEFGATNDIIEVVDYDDYLGSDSKITFTKPSQVPIAYMDYKTGKTVDTGKALSKAKRELSQKDTKIQSLQQVLKSEKRERGSAMRRCKECERKLADMQHKYQEEIDQLRGRNEAMVRKRLEKKERRREIYEDPDTYEIEFDKENDSKLAILVKRLRFYINFALIKYAPFRRDLLFVEARFGDSIATYFAFHRWMLLTSIMLSFMSIWVFLVYHIVVIANLPVITTFDNTSNSTEITATEVATQIDIQTGPIEKYLPFGWILYSSFTSDEKIVFSISTLVIVLVYAAHFVIKMLDVFKEASTKSLEEDYFSHIRYSRAVLPAIDFSIAGNKRDVETSQFAVAASLRVLIDSDVVKEKKQTTACLVLLRIASGFLQCLLIVLTWLFFLVLKIYNDDIIGIFSNDSDSIVFSIASLIPSGIITLVTMILPSVMVFLTDMEKWEAPELILVLNVIRVYAIKLITVIIIVIQGIEDLTGESLGTKISSMIGVGNEEIAEHAGEQLQCPQDKIATNLNLLLVTTLIGKTVAIIASVKVQQACQGDVYVKPEYDTAGEIIDLLYFQSIQWMCLPFSPFSIVVGSVFLYMLFKFNVYLISNYLAKPVRLWPAKTVTSWFLALYLLTFTVAQGSNYYVWYHFENATCGPFRDEPMLRWLQSSVYKNEYVRILANIIVSPVFLMPVLALFIVLDARRRYQTEALQEHLVVSQERGRSEMESFHKQIAGLKLQVENLKQ